MYSRLGKEGGFSVAAVEVQLTLVSQGALEEIEKLYRLLLI